MPITTLVEKIRGALKSWTVWVNSLVLTVLYALPEILPQMPAFLAELTPYIGEEHYKRLMFWILIVNLLLRFKTKTNLTEK